MCQAESPQARVVVAVLGLVTAACLLALLSMLILTLWEEVAGAGLAQGGQKSKRESTGHGVMWDIWGNIQNLQDIDV